MAIDQDHPALRGIGGDGLGLRPEGAARSALRARSAAWAGAPTGDDRSRRRRARQPRYRRSATTFGAHGALIRALAARIGPDWRLIESGGEPWASATFVGERHRLVAEVGAADLTGIADWEFALSGHIVADIVLVDSAGGQAVIEALTLVDR